MAPYDALYGRKCRTSLCWAKLSERRVLGPELVSETEDKVRLIRDRLKAVSDRQKFYAYLKRLEIEYSMGDFIRLSVRATSELDCIHDVFHISILRHYYSDPTHIVPVEKIKVRPDLTFEEESVQILEQDVKVLRRKSIPLVKVLWQNHSLRRSRESLRMRCGSSILVFSDQVRRQRGEGSWRVRRLLVVSTWRH
ncbi:uncharacterized protein LOC108455610 [Gossypium arboreum]|uniref:uncharacterized protein LOC108455610 n=1 Tax=Gossypium arboreum TaxID=29729 RepID=UPI000819408C|nr:uncharacterized protein LOC108455610 [Gossypium arboreum]